MPDYATLAVTAASAFILGHWLTNLRRGRQLSALDAECQRLRVQHIDALAQASAAAIDNYKKSDDFSLLLNSEHAKGKLAGADEERAKFSITYTPVIIDHETFVSHKVDVGYDMQLHYAGFPIGEPTRRITQHQQKSKDENIEKLLGVVEKTLDLLVATMTKQKIPASINKTPHRVQGKK